jgi:hypothetical protein
MAACWTGILPAQPATKTATAVPRLVKFSGTLTDGGGKALTGVVGVTFAVYEGQEGGAPVWMETQNVQADGSGKYTALLGATRNEGIPAEVFGAGQRWLGVQAQGEAERVRVLMTSVPYSLKAVDAETLGGLPASAFALAAPAVGIAGNGSRGASTASARALGASDSAKPAAAPAAVTGSGTAGTIPVWTSGTALGNSEITQSGGNLGVGRISASVKLLVENASGVGIVGSTSSTGGASAIGVQGQAQGTTGETIGVEGTNPSTSGTGVEGTATAATGSTFGVVGLNLSSSGVGVGGNSQATTGETYGVFGTAASSGGTGVQGEATATSGANWGVYGTTASESGTGVQGESTAASGTTFGVVGSVASSAGSGVRGEATATSGSSVGVSGTNASDAGTAVQGEATAATGGTVGVYGTAASTEGYGVWGNVPAASGTTIGVYGQAASAGGFGVEGQNTAASGEAVGVYGKAVSTSGFAVEGNAIATTGNAVGVLGASASTTGVGVQGQATAVTGENVGVSGVTSSTSGIGTSGRASATTGATVGVQGESASSGGFGVYGVAGNPSTLGGELGIAPAGVWGDTKDGEAGVLATADDAEAIAAYNNAENVATLFVENQEDAQSGSNVFATFSDFGGFCDIDVSGDLKCSGSVGGHAFVGPGATREVSMYAMQAPENWFEDMGSGQLHNGAAVVALDADYAQTVNTGMEYHVFLTPKGDCKGLYVTNETGASFEVHELGGGSSSIAFDYRVVARRKGYEKIRMADLAGKIQRGPSSKARMTPAATAFRPRVVTPPAATERMAPAAKLPAHAAKAPVHAAKPVHSGALSQTPVAR